MTALLGSARPNGQAQSQSTTPTSQFVVCRVGSRLCALPLDHVTETMRPLPCEPFAGAPEFVRGVSMIRGTAVPVVDAGLLLGTEPGSATRLVSISVDGRTIGLAVDAVIGVREIAEDALHHLSPLLEGACGGTIIALGALDSELLVVLRESRIVPDSVWSLIASRAST
jgi:purine-binding chemotaxis protein CheW